MLKDLELRLARNYHANRGVNLNLYELRVLFEAHLTFLTKH